MITVLFYSGEKLFCTSVTTVFGSLDMQQQGQVTGLRCWFGDGDDLMASKVVKASEVQEIRA
jgi:hypothetical protein